MLLRIRIQNAVKVLRMENLRQMRKLVQRMLKLKFLEGNTLVLLTNVLVILIILKMSGIKKAMIVRMKKFAFAKRGVLVIVHQVLQTECQCLPIIMQQTSVLRRLLRILALAPIIQMIMNQCPAASPGYITSLPDRWF